MKNKISLAVELQEKMQEITRLVDLITSEDMEELSYKRNKELIEVDWSDNLKDKTYLALAKQDFNTIISNKNKLKETSHTVTVLIAQCYEKCLCHLLMLKSKKFVPGHNHVQLLELVSQTYRNFPAEINKVTATLCETWYKSNRYPQTESRGYEVFHLMLSMISILEVLLKFTEDQDALCMSIDFDYTDYKVSRYATDAEIGKAIIKKSK